MRNSWYFTLVFAFVATILSAQTSLEHSYPFSVQRIRMSDGTAQYVRRPYLDNGQWKLEFYNDVHQLANTVLFDLPAGASDVTVSNLTYDFFDADPGIEFIISRNFSYYTVHDDNGVKIAGDFQPGPVALSLQSGQRKLTLADTVYTVPGYTKEHVFEKGETTVRFKHLEQAGDKFYSLHQDGTLVIYNTDYSIYKSFPTGFDVTTTTYTPLLLGQYQLNGDDEVEWQLSFSAGTNKITRFYSGNTFLYEHLVDFQGIQTTLLPADWPGLPTPKSLFSYYNPTLQQAQVEVVDLPSQTLEFAPVLEDNYFYGNSFSDGLKFWPGFPPANSTTVKVLNHDYTTWTEFPVLPGDEQYFLPSHLLFDTDPDSKEIIVRNSTDPIHQFSLRTETGQTLVTFDSCTGYGISRLTSLPNKFLGSYSVMGTVKKVFVYAIPSFGPVSETNSLEQPPTLALKLIPNPVSGPVALDLSEVPPPGVDVAIIDAHGSMVLHRKGLPSGGIQILEGAEQLAPGIYWIRAYNRDGAYGWSKMVKK